MACFVGGVRGVPDSAVCKQSEPRRADVQRALNDRRIVAGLGWALGTQDPSRLEAVGFVAHQDRVIQIFDYRVM